MFSLKDYAKKGVAKAASGGKRGREPGQKSRKGKRTWTVYVYRTLKETRTSA